MAIKTASKADAETAAPAPPRPLAPWARCAAAGLARLRAIHDQTDPRDLPLRHFIALVMDQTGRHLDSCSTAELREQEPPLLPPHLYRSFPDGLGEGPLRRDLALYFAEEVSDALARLLSWLAGRVRTDADRRRCEDLAQGQRILLEGIRKVVLPPSIPKL
jgi:hypothetical protein